MIRLGEGETYERSDGAICRTVGWLTEDGGVYQTIETVKAPPWMLDPKACARAFLARGFSGSSIPWPGDETRVDGRRDP